MEEGWHPWKKQPKGKWGEGDFAPYSLISTEDYSMTVGQQLTPFNYPERTEGNQVASKASGALGSLSVGCRVEASKMPKCMAFFTSTSFLLTHFLLTLLPKSPERQAVSGLTNLF